ncbi:hypothetical protein ACHAXN_010698, partial [Cyclotella atomus]
NQLRRAKVHLHLSNNGELSSELLVNHKSKNSHHGGTSVVQLDGTLGELGLFIEGVPSEVKCSVTEVTNELTLAGNILHDGKLQESNEGEDLKSSGNGNLKGASPSLSNIRELGSIVGDVTRETDTSTGGDLSKEGQLADTSVLQLNVTETVETLLVGIIQQSQRIEESKRGLGTEFVLEGSEGGGGLASLGRGESGGAGDEGGNDGRLHFD